ncbi:orotidine-5'-phosphate decarboxylase [Enterococcus sp. RIT-PI-f]|uniref:orotidine-5'-phosphate decarboxylase n=1 Tax=Enterococcus sp. RIT-PI-f TaxID=1690244 RepID=UPI0006B8AEE6|nr:orotidine-5'-phosphate decarboxylase [Enterococcus sp. RIT-PI-f]KPG71688.1 orotidine 5'-phosphate decarboxylase [Enterococcus sp. RIT-PI-f]
MNQRPIIALDFPNKQEIEAFFTHFPQHESLFVKVGMEIFYQEGPAIVAWLKDQGHDVFLDLKLHDIPNTVERGMARLAGLGVSLTNVHAAGGIDMMEAGLAGLHKGTPTGARVPDLIAVTQLTSTSEAQMHRDQQILTSLQDSVLHYAKCAQTAGLQGVVCSAHEAKKIKEHTSENFIRLTPGIRPAGSAIGDQKRVMTPQNARKAGATMIVVGRPITQAASPYESYLAIKEAWEEQ